MDNGYTKDFIEKELDDYLNGPYDPCFDVESQNLARTFRRGYVQGIVTMAWMDDKIMYEDYKNYLERVRNSC